MHHEETGEALEGCEIGGIILKGFIHYDEKGLRMLLRKVPCLIALSAAVFLIEIADAQKPSYGLSDRENQHRSMAINIVKAINAAEADFKKNHGTYATWTSLTSTGYFTPSGTKWASEEFPTVAHAMYGPGPEIVPGWKLRLNLSKDGATYDLMLEDLHDPKCGYAVFSDDRGRVRQGRVVECEQPGEPAKG